MVTGKGLNTLIEAFGLVVDNWRTSDYPALILAGDGPSSDQLKVLAKKYAGYIRLIGFVSPSKLPSLYDMCDVFILPSLFDPWGLVVNEAMNAGKPVVTSDKVGASADLIQEGKNGAVFKAGDSQDLSIISFYLFY
ncbi:MAG: glycosyltransferase family 4 protein [Nitrospira sp.]